MVRHHEETVVVRAAPEAVFAFLDDHDELGAHMRERSWRMGGGHMATTMDERRGQAVGASIAMDGVVMGVRLHLDEVVTERVPPRRKAWATVGTPRLLVVGHYRMRVEVEPDGLLTRVRAAIDWDLPDRVAWLGRVLGPAYARWCVRQMVSSVERRFATAPTRAGAGAPQRA